MFVNNDQRLRDAGSFSQRHDNVGALRRVRTPDFDEHVLNQFEQAPSTSAREVAHEMGVDPASEGKGKARSAGGGTAHKHR